MSKDSQSFLQLLDQVQKQVIGDANNLTSGLFGIRTLAESFRLDITAQNNELDKVLSNLNALHRATSGTTQQLVQQTIVLVQGLKSTTSQVITSSQLMTTIDTTINDTNRYFGLLSQEAQDFNPPHSTRISYSVDLSIDVPAVGPTVTKFDVVKDTMGAPQYIPVSMDYTDSTFISKFTVVTLSTLYGFTFSQTGWKWDDRISLRVYDEEPVDRYDLEHPYVAIIDRIRTKELGQYKRLPEGYIVESGKVIVLVYENLSGNSKKVLCDIDLMKGTE